MQTNVAKYFARVLMVVTQLRAAIVVMPSMHGIDTFEPSLLFQLLCQTFGYAIHATHRRDYPDFIPHTHFTILPDVSLESPMLIFNVEHLFHGFVFIVQRARKIGPDIVLVDPFARFEIFFCMADRVAVFDDILSFCRVTQ